MAQIIKHRRGLIGGVKNLTARNGELIIASGSISDLAGPFVFIGSPNTVDEGVAGAFNSVSKLYTGTAAPTITAATYGSALDGTPYYASGNKSLYILNNSNVGNTQIDLTGNIEGNTISGVTINNLQSTNVSASFFTGSFKGDGTGLYNVPASGVTGLELNQIGQGTVTASITEANGFSVNTNSAITGTLNVNGNTSVTGTFVATDGAAFINQGVISQNSNLLLTSGSNLVIQDGGNLQVAGNASISGALFVSGDIYQTGSYYTQGNIVLSGSINIGDNLTGDTINFGGEISSSIIPAVNNSFDLGSPTNAWNDLYVSGTAYIENINLAGISINSISLPGDLTVSGTTTLSGSVYVEDLTNNRVVIAGVGGILEDDANFTFDGTTLKVGDGDFEVDVLSGDTRLSGSLLVKNTATVSSSLSVDGHINLTNEAQIRITDDTLNTIYGFFDGSNILGSYYQMFGSDYSNAVQRGGAEFVFDSTNGGQGGFNIAEYNGSTWLRKLFVDSSGLAVTGTTTLNGNLVVTGTTELKDTVGINSSLDVTGSATLKDTLQVKGATGLNSTLDVTGSATLKSTLEVKGATGLNSTLDVTGSVTLKDSLSVSGATTINGLTTINDDATVNGVLTVTGETQLQGNLYVSGNLQVLGSSTNVNIQSQTVDIGDNIIQVNAYSPFDRYAGLAAYDSGSSGTSGSVLWDSTNDYWLIVNSNTYSSKIIGTTASTGGTGTEISLTSGTFPIASSTNTIGDSLLTFSGTTLAFNNNKFTVDSGTGATAISGNLTLSYSGGTDGGSKTSAVTFRNSSNVLGFVSTTETTNELDGILGYNHSSGVLEFSSLIDGGTY